MPTPIIDPRLKDALLQRRTCDFSVGSDIDELKNSDKWGSERSLDAGGLRAALLAEDLDDVPADQPLEITGARITGALDLRGMTVKRPLYLFRCVVADVIKLIDASTATIVLGECKIAEIDADRVHVNGSLLIRGSELSRQLRMLSGVVEGDVDLRHSNFGAGAPIVADRIRVKGAFYLRDGFSTHARVGLEGAEIGSALDCYKGSFSHAHGPALFLNAADIKGFCIFSLASFATDPTKNKSSVTISAEGLNVRHFVTFHRATVQGQIVLRGGQIGANLNLTGLSIENPTKVALDLERARISGDVFMRPDNNPDGELEKKPFKIIGGIVATSATIGGSLIIDEATFQTDEGERLLLSRMAVSGVFRFIKSNVGRGEMSLANAKALALADDMTGWPAAGQLMLNGFDYGAFSGDAPTGWRQRVDWVRRHRQTAQFNPQPFTHLATVLRRTGNERDARMVAIVREREARRHMTPFSLWWLRNVLMEATCGHGYRPWLAAVWAFAFILLGTLVFQCADRGFAPAKEAALTKYREGKALPADYPPLVPFVYSADVFLPIVNLQQKEYWAPDPSTDEGYTAWIYRPFHILAGWFFTTIFVAGVSGLIRKD
jgi:hypothetical protein